MRDPLFFSRTRARGAWHNFLVFFSVLPHVTDKQIDKAMSIPFICLRTPVFQVDRKGSIESSQAFSQNDVESVHAWNTPSDRVFHPFFTDQFFRSGDRLSSLLGSLNRNWTEISKKNCFTCLDGEDVSVWNAPSCIKHFQDRGWGWVWKCVWDKATTVVISARLRGSSGGLNLNRKSTVWPRRSSTRRQSVSCTVVEWKISSIERSTRRFALCEGSHQVS